jgi:glycosyltransferase involved in cell wall biosynthesis
MIVWDHAIRHLQPAGGITTWWQQHCQWMSPLVTAEISSISWPAGDVPPVWMEGPGRRCSTGQAPGLGWFLRRVACPADARLFHSSYFRVPAPGPRSLVTYHDAGALRHNGVRGRMHRWMQERCLRRADLVHCVSHHARKELLAEFPWVPPRNIRVVHHGFTAEIAEERPPSFAGASSFVLFVGRRNRYKRGDLAFRALALTSGFDLVLAGGGDLTVDEAQMIDGLGISKRVQCCGQLQTAHLRWLYAHAQALWYPSENEGFGFPALEAAAAGCPVLARSGHAIEEIASGYAMLHASPSPEWLSSATAQAQAMGRRHWQERGAELVARFSWEIYATSMLAIYAELGAAR